MKYRIYFLIFSFLFLHGKVLANELMAINFVQKGEISELELLFDNNEVKASKFHVSDDKQIILDLKGVKATEKVMRAFDTSEFSGGIVFVSPYRKPGATNDLRIALQLRDNVRSLLRRRPNRVVLMVENRFGVFTEKQMKDTGGKAQTAVAEVEEPTRLNVPKSDSIEDILENLTLSGRKKYIGKKIAIDVRDVPVTEILKMIATTSGFNIIQTKEVQDLPTLSLNLTDTPWDQALDTVLGLNKLVAKKNGMILMVTTLAKATEDQKLEAAAKRIAKKEEPLVTKIFPISYAKTDDLEKIIKDYLTPKRGSLSKDERTNFLIVKDTEEVMEKIRKIVEALDTQTPQVLIESKIVEVAESYSKEIGLKEGLKFGYDPIGTVGESFSTVGGSLETGADGGPGFALSTAPSTGEGARNLFGLTITRFNRLINLDFQLQLMESESKAKIVSSPKVITQNKKKAKLSTKDTTSFTKTTGTGTEQEISFEKIDAKLNLEVTPQVTNEGSISLDISLSKEQFGTRPSANAPPDVSGRDIATNVLVDNGSTIVIGGIYSYEKREAHSGVPFLKDIPLVGWLFRTPYAPEISKNEMIIFITPRIVNQKEAGITERS